jgi:hypothetical protein
MDLDNELLSGKIISINELQINRASIIAEAVMLHPFCNLIEVRINESNEEIIIADIDLQIPSSPKIDILENERIGIICYPSDSKWPEVFALRENFPQGLIHTYLHTIERPIWICYTELNFVEDKRNFTGYKFLEMIRKWFELSSLNKIHAEDQMVEPYMYSEASVILSINSISGDPTKFVLKQIDNSSLFELTENLCFHSGIFPLVYASNPINHGFIKKTPKILSDLFSLKSDFNATFSDFIRNTLGTIQKSLTEFNSILNLKLGILISIPISRENKLEVERYCYYFIVTNNTIKEIGIDIKIWGEVDKDISMLVGAKIDENDLAEIEIKNFAIIWDFDHKHAALYNGINENNDEFAIIGVGSLGSQFINNIARMGLGQWLLVDHDTFFPHNLARHFLNRFYIGKNKAESMCAELNFLFKNDGNYFFKPLNKNFLDLNNEELKEYFETKKAIVDMSTSIAVQRKLALDLSSEIKARRITAFLNPTGKDSVLFVEDALRNVRLDQLEMNYYRLLYSQKELHGHLAQNEDKIRYSRNSCRDVSSKINQENISLHSSILTKAIRLKLEDESSSISIWRFNENLSVTKYEYLPSFWTEFFVDEWVISIDNYIIEQIYSLRNEKLPKETGGVLIGAYDFERKYLYINNYLGATIDSEEEKYTFLRGNFDLTSTIEEIREKTNNENDYVGEWHSHPNGVNLLPSKLDIEFFMSIESYLSKEDLPSIMLIIGDKKFNILFSAKQ